MTSVRGSCLLLALLVSACASQPSADERVTAALERAAEAESFHSRVTASSGGMQLIEDVTATSDSASFDMAVIEDGQRRALLTVRRVEDDVFVLDSRESDDAWQEFHADDVPDEYAHWLEAAQSPYSKEDPVGVAEGLPGPFHHVEGAEPDARLYESRADGVVPMTVELDRQGRVRGIAIRVGDSSVVIEITTYDPNPVTAPAI